MNQYQILKNISGEKRLRQAFLLSDFVRSLAIQNIKDTHKGKITKEIMREELKKRFYEG